MVMLFWLLIFVPAPSLFWKNRQNATALQKKNTWKFFCCQRPNRKPQVVAQSKQLQDQRKVNANLKGQVTKLRNQTTQHGNLLRTLVIWYTRAEPDTGFKLVAAPDLVPRDRAYLESHWLAAFELVNGPLSEYPGDDAVAEKERVAARRVIALNERYQKEQGTL